MSAVSHNSILAASLYLSGQFADQRITLAAESESAEAARFAELEIFKQVGQLFVWLLFDMEA